MQTKKKMEIWYTISIEVNYCEAQRCEIVVY